MGALSQQKAPGEESSRRPRSKRSRKDGGATVGRRALQSARAGRAAGASPGDIRGHLYDAGAKDREIVVTPQVVTQLHDRRILWVDLARRDPCELKRVAELLELDQRTLERLNHLGGVVRLDNYGSYLHLAALPPPRTAAGQSGEGRPRPAMESRVDFLVGRNWVVTVHDADASYLQAFRAQDKGDTVTGGLSAAALTASLLDWHLQEYFDEVSSIEAAIDEIDERILAEPSEECLLEQILAIRRRSSRLRRALMAQRPVFYGLGRPDLENGVEDDATAAFETLATRFERAVDEAEHTRDLSVGSFELFTSRSAQQTNELVKALTFFTVIIGTTAAVAGLFGMNFDPPFFRTGSTGFFAVAFGLLALGLLAWVIGRRRRWI